MLGITGPPGAGKSTVSEWLVGRLNEGGGSPVAAYVPMDGFHLSNLVLHARGLRDRKGAPETFDAAGYVNLLRRLRGDERSTVYAPTFNRSINESIGSAIPVGPHVRVVVSEGNYLLLDAPPPWHEVRPLLDLALYLDAPPNTRHSALVRRQLARGLTRSAAQAWAGGSDAANARLIESTRDRADRTLART